MTIGELVATVRTMDADQDIFVALFKPDGTAEVFDIEAIRDNDGQAQLDISEEETVEVESNGAVRGEGPEDVSDAADAAVDAFLDLCERRSITEEEKDLIWNAMAMICYQQVQSRHGPFYDAIKPLLTEGEA